MLKRALIAAMLSVALISQLTQASPANLNNSTDSANKAQIVQAKANEQPTDLQEPSPQLSNTVEPETQPVIKTGCEQYRTLINQYFGDKTEVFLQIANKESGCNPSAVGDDFVINGVHAVSCGLFQVRTLSSRPTCEELKDPATNIAWAKRIYLGQGFKAWSVCKVKVNCY